MPRLSHKPMLAASSDRDAECLIKRHAARVDQITLQKIGAALRIVGVDLAQQNGETADKAARGGPSAGVDSPAAGGRFSARANEAAITRFAQWGDDARRCQATAARATHRRRVVPAERSRPGPAQSTAASDDARRSKATAARATHRRVVPAERSRPGPAQSTAASDDARRSQATAAHATHRRVVPAERSRPGAAQSTAASDDARRSQATAAHATHRRVVPAERSRPGAAQSTAASDDARRSQATAAHATHHRGREWPSATHCRRVAPAERKRSDAARPNEHLSRRAIERADAATISRSRSPLRLEQIARGPSRTQHSPPRSAFENAGASRRASSRLPVVRIKQTAADRANNADLISTICKVARPLRCPRGGPALAGTEMGMATTPLARCLKRRPAPFAHKIDDRGGAGHHSPARR